MAVITPWLWMNGLKDYQRDRLVLFLDPSQDPLVGAITCCRALSASDRVGCSEPAFCKGN